MSMTPYFVPHVPGLPGVGVEEPDLTTAQRRGRTAGAALLVLLAVGAAAGVVAERTGALSSGLLAGALALVFGLALLGGVVTDVVVSARGRRAVDGVRPGLRAASFFYLGALLCLGVTFAFLAG